MSRKLKLNGKSSQTSLPKTKKTIWRKIVRSIEILAAIATIVGVLYAIFCTKDYSDEIGKSVQEIKKQSFVMEQMPDSLLRMTSVEQARDVQKRILTIKDYIDNIDFAPRDNEDTQMGIYRYVKEMERFEILCNEVIKLNESFSIFVKNNPQYGTMFNLNEYQEATNKEMELIPKVLSDIKASNGMEKSPEKKLKLLKRALNSKEMLELMDIQRDILLQVFDYMNKVQREVKLNHNN